MTQFDSIYGAVDPAQREGLRSFRQQNEQHHLQSEGTDWSYYKLGDGQIPLLWLVGGIKVADVAWNYYPYLSNTCNIIAPDYPPLHTMEALADGLKAILDAEKIAVVNLLGGSFGGMLAQIFIRRYPERTNKIILSTTSFPNAASIQNYVMARNVVHAITDDDLLAEGAQTQMLRTIDPSEDEVTYYKAFLHELYTQRLDRTDIVSTYNCLINFHQQTFKPDDVELTPDQMLIISAGQDKTFDSSMVQMLHALYPQAMHHVFEDSGHSLAGTYRERYFDLIRSFLQN